MVEKTTDDLRQELMESGDIDTFLHENVGIFVTPNVALLLNTLYNRTSLSKAAFARASGMSEAYLHQVFSGQHNLSRDRLLCMCWAFRWMKRSSCCSRLAMPGCTHVCGGMQSSCMVWCTVFRWEKSTTSCLTKTKNRCSDRSHSEIVSSPGEQVFLKGKASQI